MPRYIDADKLIAEYDRVHIGAPGGARKLMENAPTADVVEVTRCKDCKYWKHWKSGEDYEGYCNCKHLDMLNDTNADDFCSYGERKENTNEQKRNT